MTPARISIAVAAAAVLALVIVGLTQIGGETGSTPPSHLTLAQMRARLAGSAPRLAALHEQAGEILQGGLPSLRARLAQLRGTPVVVNKWASWCAPCRAEFGAFQQVAVDRGRIVAFLGIDSADTSRSDAVAFLRSHPVPYPSWFDPSGQAGTDITDSTFTPVTVFRDRRGGEYIHQGPYATTAALEADVIRYALDG